MKTAGASNATDSSTYANTATKTSTSYTAESTAPLARAIRQHRYFHWQRTDCLARHERHAHRQILYRITLGVSQVRGR